MPRHKKCLNLFKDYLHRTCKGGVFNDRLSPLRFIILRIVQLKAMGALLNQQDFAGDSTLIAINEDGPFFRKCDDYVFHGRIIAANGISFKLGFEPTRAMKRATTHTGRIHIPPTGRVPNCGRSWVSSPARLIKFPRPRPVGDGVATERDFGDFEHDQSGMINFNGRETQFFPETNAARGFKCAG